MVEKPNATSGKMIKNLVFGSYNKYPIDIIIAWATNAKNSYTTITTLAEII